jgi:hypothetical protein
MKVLAVSIEPPGGAKRILEKLDSLAREEEVPDNE